MGASALFAVQAAMQAGQAVNEFEAERGIGRFKGTQGDYNARMTRLQADDARRRGDLEAAALRRRGAQVAGAQRAAYAGQGVDVGSGIASAIVAETGAITEQDVVTTKNNAWREAWGLEAQASEYERQGRMDRLESKNKSRNSLMTGGLAVLGTYGQYKGYAGKERFKTAKSSNLNGGKPVRVAPANYYKGRV